MLTNADNDRSNNAVVRIGVLVAVVVWAGLALAMIASLFRDATTGAEVAASKDLIGPLLTGTGVIIAVFAFLRDRQKIARDRQDSKSKILYEQARAGLEEAYQLLRDQNNDRITWVRASRLIAQSQQLAGSILSPEYKTAYLLAEEGVRAKMYEALTVRGEDGARNSLPPAFFFGRKDWKTSQLNLDELAKATSPRARVYSVTDDQVVPDVSTVNLAGRSVLVVMDFLNFRSDYQDPLDAVEHKNFNRWPDSWGPTQGARRYLSHLEKFVAVAGKLMPRGKTKEELD